MGASSSVEGRREAAPLDTKAIAQAPDVVEVAQPLMPSPSISKSMEVEPSDVVGVGCAVIASAAVVGAVVTYRSGSKSLIEDGINPSNRLRMIPVAVQTLMLSTLFTGVLGAAGFYALRGAGWFSAERAELPSAAEVARMLRSPKAYFQEALDEERRRKQRSGPAGDGVG